MWGNTLPLVWRGVFRPGGWTQADSRTGTPNAKPTAKRERWWQNSVRVAATVTYAAPQVDIISNVTGEQITAEAINPEYWCRHLRSSVQFTASLQKLHTSGYEVFVEIGPKPTLLGMGRYCLPEVEGVWLPSLRQGQEGLAVAPEFGGTLRSWDASKLVWFLTETMCDDGLICRLIPGSANAIGWKTAGS